MLNIIQNYDFLLRKEFDNLQFYDNYIQFTITCDPLGTGEP